MIVAFFESFKYVGHLFPLAMLRIYMGFFFLGTAYRKYDGDFLFQPRLAAQINEWMPLSSAPDWYKSVIESVIVPNWRIFAYTITYCEFLIGVSFVIGFLVRPMALLGFLVCLNFVYMSSPESTALYKTFLAMFVTMAWLGAGRCLGFDYFFFKRQRGIWW